ncbi:hypothetical protein [Shewanella violacea]|uniref:hypothetical protein n=1 Tax=Shewanella violacea TaxID=60217 RepID=UPI00059E5E49|nr:hypothetical protein [Shewanella violacea]
MKSKFIISNLINAALLCVVCGSVYATQHKIDEGSTVINGPKVDVLEQKVNSKKGNDDVIVVPMGQCEPMPFCQQQNK